MQINIAGQNVDITPPLKQYIEEKFAKLEHRLDNITHIDVVMSIEKLRQIIKAHVHVKGSVLNAKSESEDMYAAIDDIIDKLERQATKYKEKNQDHSD